MEDRPLVGLGICIVRQGKVLLGKRKNTHGEGSWGFPGGHLEFNESYEECARREVQEEVGIRIKNIRFVTATNDLFPREKKHYITIYVLADYDSGEVVNKEPHKLEYWDWFSWEDLPHPLFIPLQNLLKTDFNPISNKYQHYKGNYYEIITEGKHSDTQEELVIYKALYGSAQVGKNLVWVRPKKDFFQIIEHEGKLIPRFSKIS